MADEAATIRRADSFGRRLKYSTASFGRRIKRAASFDRRAKPPPRATPPSFAAGFVFGAFFDMSYLDFELFIKVYKLG